jgi:hypothetical protein
MSAVQTMSMCGLHRSSSHDHGPRCCRRISACGIWRLSEGWEVEVEMRESPLSKVVMPMLKVTAIIRKQEVGHPSKHELLRWQIS